MSANAEIDAILELARIYGRARGLTLSTVSRYVAGAGHLFPKLDRRAAQITLARRDAILARFSQLWPADLAWPSDIPRPALREAA